MNGYDALQESTQTFYWSPSITNMAGLHDSMQTS